MRARMINLFPYMVTGVASYACKATNAACQTAVEEHVPGASLLQKVVQATQALEPQPETILAPFTASNSSNVSYCTHAPDYSCFEKGWPSCCVQSGECPEMKPECDAASNVSYCTHAPDYACFANGWPSCCVQSGECPEMKPECDVASCPTDASGCVTSPNYPRNYGNSESCTFVFGSAPGRIVDFVTESSFDRLIVDSSTYSGAQTPVNVAAGVSIRWTTDGSATAKGWKICEGEAFSYLGNGYCRMGSPNAPESFLKKISEYKGFSASQCRAQCESYSTCNGYQIHTAGMYQGHCTLYNEPPLFAKPTSDSSRTIQCWTNGPTCPSFTTSSTCRTARCVWGNSTCQSPPCNWQCYLDRYADLRHAFGANNIAAAQHHWETRGQKQLRDCTCQEGDYNSAQEVREVKDQSSSSLGGAQELTPEALGYTKHTDKACWHKLDMQFATFGAAIDRCESLSATECSAVVDDGCDGGVGETGFLLCGPRQDDDPDFVNSDGLYDWSESCAFTGKSAPTAAPPLTNMTPSPTEVTPAPTAAPEVPNTTPYPTEVTPPPTAVPASTNTTPAPTEVTPPPTAVPASTNTTPAPTEAVMTSAVCGARSIHTDISSAALDRCDVVTVIGTNGSYASYSKSCYDARQCRYTYAGGNGTTCADQGSPAASASVNITALVDGTYKVILCRDTPNRSDCPVQDTYVFGVADGKVAQPCENTTWTRAASVYCSDDWDYNAVRANNVELDACKIQCQLDLSCVGVSVSNAYYHSNHDDSPHCGICKSTTTANHGNFDTYWKDV